jgi:outer membrane protein assembly factor BamB
MSVFAGSAAAQWTQWGGPNQDFKAEGCTLARKWPDKGPKKLWTRKLGEGYSSIIVDDGTLYTMYRTTEEDKEKRKEVVVAMNAADGKVLWQRKYEAPIPKNHVAQFGIGPRATPLVYGDKLYTIGVGGKMHCLDKKTGKVKWSHELWGDEFGGTVLKHGYSSSPIGYKDTIIVLVGGKGHSIVAFDKDSGKVVWKMHDFINSYSTPKIVEVDGKDQMITFMAQEVIGVDPGSGELLWKFTHKNQVNLNITLPIWDQKEHTIFITSPAGSKGLKLSEKDGKYSVEQVWEDKRLIVLHTTAVRAGDTIYASSGSGGRGGGGGGPSFICAVNAKTGATAWKERGFSKANLIYADGRFIILDEDGNLALTECTPESFKVISSTPLLKKVAWTVPTLVGKTLYVRDQDKIFALDVG